jgi:hypothetical protein
VDYHGGEGVAGHHYWKVFLEEKNGHHKLFQNVIIPNVTILNVKIPNWTINLRKNPENTLS